MFHRSGYVFTDLLANFMKLLKINIEYYMNEISYLANDLYRTDKTRYDDISTGANNNYFYFIFLSKLLFGFNYYDFVYFINFNLYFDYYWFLFT